MLKTKNGGSILCKRWGSPRSKSHLCRISPWLHQKLKRVYMPYRRKLLDDAFRFYLAHNPDALSILEKRLSASPEANF